MTKLYYQDLRKRLEKIEAKWAWASVDSKGVVTGEKPTKAVALWEREKELHEAEMARLEAELDALDRQPTFTMPDRITPLTPTLPRPHQTPRTPSPAPERRAESPAQASSLTAQPSPAPDCRVGSPAQPPSQQHKQAA